MDEPGASEGTASRRAWRGWAAALGFAFPYVVILLGWSLAPDAVREHYHPDGDRIRARVNMAVLGSAVAGVLLALPWAGSRPRPASWWVGAVVALVVQVVGVFCFNVWYYVSAGGAFP